ncbi:VOC family protein [Alkaliphilus peptidifermentans]|uniref:Catechol 2,3-dioxygenase n=1 Tax=Alkaliphilus peptidifermentans DSM 18978 TaxID=1120976 RepID=A0A1G5F086_9FIRM|nr:VOC family protein [Alkaliphilus peptidifermentans]SCY32685.1 Catechol 2,3-dioxygenase [Alkaliphilus peptidifermentans DSM 18978]
MLTLEHVGICANNTKLLKDWYIQLFNFKVVYDNQKEMPTYFLLMDDESMLEIYPMDHSTETKTNKHQGIRHIAFGTDNAEKEYENLMKNNVEIIDELKSNPKGIKTIFFKDPEGNIIHFIERPTPLV